jgi:hypothetical protein
MLMTYTEMRRRPRNGLRFVFDLTWDRRDRPGCDWFVVERGHTSGPATCVDLYSDAGRLVAACRTLFGARNRAGKERARQRRLGVSAVIDIVRRDEVEMRTSAAPYGCFVG